MRTARPALSVPAALAGAQTGAQWRAWTEALPALATEFLDRWHLRLDGQPDHGSVALVLPVLREDGTPAVLKLQPVDAETRGEPLALRAWGGHRAVRLLDSDSATGTMLLERLDSARSLQTLPDSTLALRHLSELLADLSRTPAPPGLPQLGEVARAMLAELPRRVGHLADPAERRLLTCCAAAVREVVDQPGDRLLHWDLHYANVLAPRADAPVPDRGCWLAIDPKPLAGDPGFELLPALRNRWEDLAAEPSISRAVRRRFHLMTEVAGLDRQRAGAWTLARVLQNALWDIEDGDDWLEEDQVVIAQVLLGE